MKGLVWKDFTLGIHDQSRKESCGYREIRQEVTAKIPVITALTKAVSGVIRREEIDIRYILWVESVRISDCLDVGHKGEGTMFVFRGMPSYDLDV